jgi:AAA15 family ATPase/GTPase
LAIDLRKKLDKYLPWLEVIRKRTIELFSTPRLRDFTDHTPEGHSERIIDILNALCSEMMGMKDKKLNTEEIFVLLASAYLHDVGMQYAKDPELRLIDIRERHHELSEKMILGSLYERANWPDLGIPMEYADEIAKVSRGHRRTDLYTREYDALHKNGKPIRLRLLVALLSLADDLDLTYRRVVMENLELSSVPQESRVYWWRYYYIEAVSISEGKIQLFFCLPSPIYERIVVPSVEHQINSRLSELREILWDNGIRLYLKESQRRYSSTKMPMSQDDLDFLKRQEESRVYPRASYSPFQQIEHDLEEGVPRFCLPIALKRVTLHNIKCFRHLELTLCEESKPRSWTLLIGDNAVGKTTILQCIALCSLGPVMAQKIRISPQNILRNGTETGFMEAVFETSIDDKNRFANPSETVIRLQIEKGTRTIGFDKDNADMRRFVEMRESVKFKGWFVAGYGASRNLLFGEEPYKIYERDLIVDRVESLFDPAKILLEPTSMNRFLSGDLSPFKEMGAPPRLKPGPARAIRILIEKLLPAVSYSGSIGKGNIGTAFGECPISELSDGYKSMLSWLTHLVMHLLAATNWKHDFEDVKGIILIDEIDLHLHPKWQRTVIDNLRKAFPMMQFIATSHSPMTIGGLDTAKGEIVLLKAEEGNIRSYRDIPSIKGWRADQILTGPLFDLQSTRDLETEKLLSEYVELAARDNLPEAESSRLKRIADTLRIRLPLPAEKEEAREAFEMLQNALKQQWEAKPVEERQKIINEIRVRIQELITDSGMPR